MRFMKWMIGVLLLVGLQLGADEEASYRPVYAGTLLNFYSQNAAPGRLVFEPILFATRNYGFYNKSWNVKKQTNVDEIELLLSFETGITDFMDINLIVAGLYGYADGRSSVRYEDTFALLGFQVANDVKGSWTPDCRIILGESFPTGKHDQLNPKKLESDASGSGAFETSLILVLQKIFYTFPKHPFNLNLNLYYIYLSDVEVRGFNVYGGGYGTKGVADPGSQYIASLGIEVTLDKHWEIGTNIFYQHNNSVSFSGVQGVGLDGGMADVGLPSSEQLSLAPSLEYNFSKNMRMAGGVWFTVAGRNADAFVSAVLEYFYYF